MKKFLFYLVVSLCLIILVPRTNIYIKVGQSVEQINAIYRQYKLSAKEVQNFMSSAPDIVRQYNDSMTRLEEALDNSTNNLNKAFEEIK